MLKTILKKLTSLKNPDGTQKVLLGYFLQDTTKKLAISQSFAIKSQVYGLEVVIGDTRICRETFQDDSLDEFTTILYLTQHEGLTSTIDEVLNILRKDKDFYSTEVYFPTTPSGTGTLRRAVLTLNHRCECP